jgi:hypothetical protein
MNVEHRASNPPRRIDFNRGSKPLPQRLIPYPGAKKVGSASAPTSFGGHGGPPYVSSRIKRKVSHKRLPLARKAAGLNGEEPLGYELSTMNYELFHLTPDT